MTTAAAVVVVVRKYRCSRLKRERVEAQKTEGRNGELKPNFASSGGETEAAVVGVKKRRSTSITTTTLVSDEVHR